MDTTGTTNTTSSASKLMSDKITSAKPLSPLELNGIKLDMKHTILTPDYLERLTQPDTSIPTK